LRGAARAARLAALLRYDKSPVAGDVSDSNTIPETARCRPPWRRPRGRFLGDEGQHHRAQQHQGDERTSRE